MTKKVVRFFDTLEDHVRAALSHYPIAYALVGGVGIVLFWKGVWETAEYVPALYGPASVLLGIIILLTSGLLVSFFIGDNIIISGFRQEKKLVEKTEEEVLKEESSVAHIAARLSSIEEKLGALAARRSRTNKEPA